MVWTAGIEPLFQRGDTRLYSTSNVMETGIIGENFVEVVMAGIESDFDVLGVDGCRSEL